MNGQPLTEEEIRDCLERSGYLMESRIVRMLNDAEFFVEPNQAIKDARTGKSREIDILAERHRFDPARPNTAVWTNFALETINNPYPFVLLTPRPNTPNANFETYVRYYFTPQHNNVFMMQLDMYDVAGVNWDNLFSQYCALTPKKHGDPSRKRELMATHPDDVYSSLLKLAEYVEYEYQEWDTRSISDEYWRLLFWRPMLVLSGRLLTVHWNDKGSFTMEEAKMGRLEFNWHLEGEARSTIIDIVTEDFLMSRIEALCAKDEELLQAIFEIGLKSGRNPKQV